MVPASSRPIVLNRQHSGQIPVLWGIFQRPHTLDYIRQVLAEYFADKPMRQVQAFGLYAWGDSPAESELNLLLEMERQTGRAFFDYSRELTEWLGIAVEAHTVGADYIPGLRLVLEKLYINLNHQFAPAADV